MSKKTYRLVPIIALVFIAAVWMTISLIGQSGASATYFPSVAKGDWPAYTGDNTGARYSPQAQINAQNFNKLEVAWHFKTDNLGTKPEFKLEGTPSSSKGFCMPPQGPAVTSSR